MPNEQIRVSFDFDDTLTQKHMKYVISYLKRRYPGITIYVVTARYCEALKHLYLSKPCNRFLYKRVKALGIPKKNIIFTNMEDKHSILSRANVLFHVDDKEPITPPDNYQWIDVNVDERTNILDILAPIINKKKDQLKLTRPVTDGETNTN